MLVSLGARVMTANYLAYVARSARQTCDSFTVCLLDKPETINQVYLNNLSPQAATEYVHGRCGILVAGIANDPALSVKLTTWTKIASEPDFPRYLSAVEELYVESHKFESHCRNQVFQNLQPILQVRGVKNRRHQLTNVLAPYIIQEIALKLYIADKRLADVEFAPEAEMGILHAIYEGKYPELQQLAGSPLSFVVIAPPTENDHERTER
jgi:hypothetical protein